MPEPVTMTAILGGAAFNIVCGLATNCMEPQRKALWGRVGNWWTKGKSQENHDVLKATHAAYVAAMAKMASAASAIAFTDEERDAAKALTALVANPTFAAFRWDAEHLPLDACQQRIETLFAGRYMPGSEDEGWRTYNRLIVSDLAAWGVDLPPALAALFIDGHEPHAPWHLAFRHAFAEQLKADEKNPEGERAFRILTFERLNELTANGAVLVEALEELHAKLDRLQAGQDADRARDESFQSEASALLRRLVAASQDGARERGVTDAALLALASRVAENVSDPAQALTELHRAIDDLIRLRDEAARGTNLGDLVDEVLRRMDAANAEGRIDDAAKTGERAYAEWQDQQAAAKQAGLRLIEANIEQHRLRFDAEQMTHWICERLAIEHGRPADAAQLRIEQDVWYERGLTQASRLDLDVSIGLAERSVAAATDVASRADCQIDLAIALQVQGERGGGEAGLALLARAVTTYHAALEVYTREAAPEDWATTQNNLSAALRVQGERSGGEPGLALLAQAVDGYHAVLEVYTREAAPADWAMTQHNLGAALAVQGQHSGGEAGLALLTQAVIACHAALEVHTREAVPADWAMTQHSLGAALQAQGQLSGGEAGLALLAQAVDAYHAVLEVYTREAAPAHWAMTQHNLGAALAVQGQLSGGEAGLALLARAVNAYHAALELRTLDATPAKWAATQEHIAITLLSLSCMADGMVARDHAVAARTACQAALSVYSPEHMPYYHEKATGLLADIDARLAELGDAPD